MANKIFNFHGAFKSKRNAVKKERKTPHSFIKSFGYGRKHRYAVVTRKKR